MEIEQIASKQDLLKLEGRLKNFMVGIFKENFQNTIQKKSNYLRTKQVKLLLKVSDNKLKTMRENGEIPWSFIGQTYYYPEDEILDILEKNIVRKYKQY